MDLEDQIRSMNNSQEFVKIVNTVFTSQYKTDFQTIDGTRPDEGNDGYVRSEKRLLAIYCPTKPETKTDKEFKRKISEDMVKAKKLKDSGKIQIEKWTFVTPGKLSHELLVFLDEKAKEYGVVANHIEATYLSDELLRNRHLVEKFPDLHMSSVEETMKTLVNEIKELKTPHEEKNKIAPDNVIYKGKEPTHEPSNDSKEVFNILKNQQTNNSKTELRTIYYRTTDKVAQINVIFGMIHWFEPADDKYEDMVDWCNQGIKIADTLNEKSLTSLLLSFKGLYLSYMWARKDLDCASAIRMGNAIGIQTVSAAQQEKTIQELRLLENEFEESFKMSVNIAIKIKNASILGRIFMNIGQAAGGRYLHLNAMGVEGASSEKALTKRMYLQAKELFAAIGDETSVGYALHNLTNDLKNFGEIDEAKALNKTVIEVANKHNNKSLLQVALWLKETLETGKIPDYIHGERRERKI